MWPSHKITTTSFTSSQAEEDAILINCGRNFCNETLNTASCVPIVLCMDLPRQSSSVLHRNTFVTLAAKPTSSGYHCLDRTLLRQRAPVFHTPNQQSSLTSRLSWSGVARAKGRQYLSPPERKFEVDDELWSVLDICSDQELEDVHKILFGKTAV